MKTLFLLRHAKSSWANPGLRDFDRPLSSRGREAAPKMGTFMAEKGLKPDLVLSSSSKRTRETFTRFEEGFGESLKVRFLDDLYHSSAQLMLNLAQNAPEDVRNLMLIGHNPGMHEAALSFLAHGPEADTERLDYKFPTAALAHFTFRAEVWPDVEFGEGKLERLVYPKDL